MTNLRGHGALRATSILALALLALHTASCRPEPAVSQVFDTNVELVPIGTIPGQGMVSEIAFSNQDPDLVLTAGMRGVVKSLRIDTGSVAWESRQFRAMLDEVAFSPNGEIAAVVGNRGTVFTLDTRTGRILQELIGHAGMIQCVAFSPDGQYIATGSHDATVMLWDAETGMDVHHFAEWAGSQVSSLAFSADGRFLAAGISEELAIWDLTSFRKTKSIGLGELWVTKMLFSPDMAYVALIGSFNGGENDALVLDVESEREVARLVGHTREIRALEFSADHTRLITGSQDSTVRVWDVLSARPISVRTGFNRWVLETGLSRDGRRLVVSDMSGDLLLFEVPQ